MEFFNYLASNVPLFSICAVMIFLAIRNFKLRRKESIFILVFTGIVLLLSAIVGLERYSARVGNVTLATVATSCGYIFRPLLIYFFIFLANMDEKRSKIFSTIMAIPIGINFIVYLLPLFMGIPGISSIVFSYKLAEDGTAEFVRGGFLNFCSHFICLFYIFALVYVSTLRFHGKHRRDGLVIIMCVFIIVITVMTEMIAKRDDLLNIVCEICLMINYIFITSVNASRDPLTNLYDRRTYYEDISRYENIINGVIQIDMNELKYLNDNFGHEAGDIALQTLARIFENSINKNTMCTYRLSGDEFLVLMFQGTKEDLENAAHKMKEKLKESKYSAAIGYLYYDKSDNITYDQAMKKAEEYMYAEKEEFYRTSGKNRRKN